MSPIRSLLLVEDKLLEAEYFVSRLHVLQFAEFTYELNAFLSAAKKCDFLVAEGDELRSRFC